MTERSSVVGFKHLKEPDMINQSALSTVCHHFTSRDPVVTRLSYNITEMFIFLCYCLIISGGDLVFLQRCTICSVSSDLQHAEKDAVKFSQKRNLIVNDIHRIAATFKIYLLYLFCSSVCFKKHLKGCPKRAGLL